MTINRQHLEAISTSAQNDAIALAEVYREVFTKKLNVEMENALNQELSSHLKAHNEIAAAVINSVATSYADNILIQSESLHFVRILKPRREEKPTIDNLQSLLPPEKPKLKAV